MSSDRLDWIFADDGGSGQLVDRYDEWAEQYDDDHYAWGWRGPAETAAAYLNSVDADVQGAVLDAGCGTGSAGAAMRTAGLTSALIGVDLSKGMLEQAQAAGSYTHLLRCSIEQIPLTASSVAGVVSSGVFTHGHVGGEAFAELCRVTRPGGVISITQRVDLIDAYSEFASRLEEEGRWELMTISDPQQFHPLRDDHLQSVVSWRVT